MPHYLIQLEDEERFAVYSTVVDGLITAPMTAERTRQWVEEDERYSSWLTPYDPDEAIAQQERYGGTASDGMKNLLRDQARYFYFHAVGFCYAKLSDAYFCLPRQLWRNGK